MKKKKCMYFRVTHKQHGHWTGSTEWTTSKKKYQKFLNEGWKITYWSDKPIKS